jgi:DNA-binding MarR family transcriptional regulator
VQLPRSTFELLFRAARLVNEAAIARVQAVGGTLRTAHTQLFPHITSDGIRLTELAERIGVTKQAIGPLVDDLERQRFVERVEDPADRRAKRIRWTRKGQRALLHGISQQVGKARLADLATTCERIVSSLESSASDVP